LRLPTFKFRSRTDKKRERRSFKFARLSKLFIPLACIANAAILSGCAKTVSSASQKSIQRLHLNTAKATPREVSSSGQLILQYPWFLPDGTELILPLKSPLGVPTIEAHLNEEPIPLIFDTGNTFPVLLDIQTAIKSGVTTLKGSHAKGSGIGGNVNITIARFNSLRMRNTRVLGPGISGVFLERFSYVSFDGLNETVRLGYKRAYAPKTSALCIPFTRRDGRLWMDLWIGSMKIQAFFDSGCGTSLRIPKETLDSIPKNLVLSQSIKQRKAMGVGGVEVEDVGVLREAKIGNLKISPLEFDTTSSTTETLLGWGPFKNSRLTIDFVKNKIWFER
jgi:hypothetical protein